MWRGMKWLNGKFIKQQQSFSKQCERVFVSSCVHQCELLIHIGEKPSYLQRVGILGNGKVICFTNRIKAKRE